MLHPIINTVTEKLSSFMAENILIPLGILKAPKESKKNEFKKEIDIILNKELSKLEAKGNTILHNAKKRMAVLVFINLLFLIIALFLKKWPHISLAAASIFIWALLIYTISRFIRNLLLLFKESQSPYTKYIKLFIRYGGFIPPRTKKVSRIVFNHYYHDSTNKAVKISHKVLAKTRFLPGKNELFEHTYYRVTNYLRQFWNTSLLYFVILIGAYTLGIFIYRAYLLNEIYHVPFIDLLAYPASYFF
jgi:hypothetical protein